MMMREARWCALVLVLMASASFVGCGVERPAAAEAPATSPAPVRAAAKTTFAGDITFFPDGSSAIGPHIADVAMLKRLPNGTYARTCGAPDPETRTMMEGVMRARRGSR